MKKVVNILYTVIIPIAPLVLHIFINLLTDTSIKLEYIYPELFFATISICVESIKILEAELKYNDIKSLMLFVLLMLLVLASVSYGSILATNNRQLNVINIKIALITSLIIFLSSIFIHISIIIFREV